MLTASEALTAFASAVCCSLCFAGVCSTISAPTARRMLLNGLLVAIVPFVAISFWLGRGGGHNLLTSACQGAFLTPLLLVWPVSAWVSLPPGVNRAAMGLGAGNWACIRLIWMPLLRRSLIGSLLLVATCCVIEVIVPIQAP